MWGKRRGSDVMDFLRIQAAFYGVVIREYPTSIIRRTLVILMSRWKYSKGLVFKLF